MSATNSLHYELCVKAGVWIRQRKNAEPWETPYKWAAVELNTCVGECPDVWATNGYLSCIIEVKTSKEDFLKDQKKVWRTVDNLATGTYRYYLCPKDLIRIDELPFGWGLIEYDGKRLKKVLQARPFDNTDKTHDLMILSSIMIREGVKPQTFNYRYNSNMYNESYHNQHSIKEIRNEYIKCREDFNYFKEHYVNIDEK